MLLVGWQERHPACKKLFLNSAVGCRHGYLSGARLTKPSPGKKPLNGCACVINTIQWGTQKSSHSLGVYSRLAWQCQLPQLITVGAVLVPDAHWQLTAAVTIISAAAAASCVVQQLDEHCRCVRRSDVIKHSHRAQKCSHRRVMLNRSTHTHASKVTTLWHYTNTLMMIIIITISK